MTTNSLSRRPEKAHENEGIPLRALILSLALHALLLGGLTQGPEFQAGNVAPAEMLHAVLRPVPRIASVPSAASQAVAPAAPSRIMQRHEAEAAAPAAVPPAPGLVPDAPTAAAMAVAEAGSVPTSRTMPQPASIVPTGARGPDAAGLRQYRLALAAEARRFRRYPDAARQEGITGTAEVRVTVSAAGTPRQADLASSSGHAALDAAALDMLRRAAARTVLPESLRGQEFAVLLPVVFEVED